MPELAPPPGRLHRPARRLAGVLAALWIVFPADSHGRELELVSGGRARAKVVLARDADPAEATAAAEAMTMCRAVSRMKEGAFFVADDCHPQTVAVIAARAEPIGLDVVVADPAIADLDGNGHPDLIAPGKEGIRDRQFGDKSQRGAFAAPRLLLS